MQKEITISLRLNKEELEKLEAMAAQTVRNKSDMIRYLIHKEHGRRSTTDKVPSNRRYKTDKPEAPEFETVN